MSLPPGVLSKRHIYTAEFLCSSVDSMKQNIFQVKDLASPLAAWFSTRKHLFRKGKTYSDLTEIFSKRHFT